MSALCHVICKYRTFLTLMETPGPEAPPQRGNEGMAVMYTNCTLRTLGEKCGKQFYVLPLTNTQTYAIMVFQWFIFLMMMMYLFSVLRLYCNVQFRLSPDQYLAVAWLRAGARRMCTLYTCTLCTMSPGWPVATLWPVLPPLATQACAQPPSVRQ